MNLESKDWMITIVSCKNENTIDDHVKNYLKELPNMDMCEFITRIDFTDYSKIMYYGIHFVDVVSFKVITGLLEHLVCMGLSPKYYIEPIEGKVSDIYCYQDQETGF